MFKSVKLALVPVAVILKQNDFNQNAYYLEEPVAVYAANTLEVKLGSIPASHITITIVGYYLSEDVDDDNDGYTENEGDCDDTNPAINPSSAEVCDYIDNNCDGAIDEGVTNVYYLDGDGDGYGLESITAQDCVQLAGYAGVVGDCDDTLATVNPGAAEVCNDIDDNWTPP